VGADCIVHYGRSCLSPTARLPLMYVFQRSPVDLPRCAGAFREQYPDAQSHVVVLYDVNYAHVIGRLRPSCRVHHPGVHTRSLGGGGGAHKH